MNVHHFIVQRLGIILWGMVWLNCYAHCKCSFHAMLQFSSKNTWFTCSRIICCIWLCIQESSRHIKNVRYRVAFWVIWSVWVYVVQMCLSRLVYVWWATSNTNTHTRTAPIIIIIIIIYFVKEDIHQKLSLEMRTHTHTRGGKNRKTHCNNVPFYNVLTSSKAAVIIKIGFGNSKLADLNSNHMQWRMTSIYNVMSGEMCTASR